MAKYPKVSAAEKYAEGPKPLCDCHDQPQRWSASARKRGGGQWNCAVKNRVDMRERYRKDRAYRERQNERRRDNREWAIEYLGGLCGNGVFGCGQPERWGIENGYGQFEFDHIDRNTKSFTIAHHFTSSKAKLRPELDKCQLLHVECHKAKTAQERGQDATATQDQLDALLNQYGSEAA